MTLLGFSIEAEFLEVLQYLVHMLLMLFPIGRIDEYVVEVAYREVVNVWLLAIINARLETSRCVC